MKRQVERLAEQQIALQPQILFPTACLMLTQSLTPSLTHTTIVGATNQVVRKVALAKAEGFTAFKMKCGVSIEDDVRRAKFMREAIGPDMCVPAPPTDISLLLLVVVVVAWRANQGRGVTRWRRRLF